MLEYILITLIIISLSIILFYRFYFLRNPNRSIPGGDNIICPANGKIVQIIETKGTEVSIDKGILGNIKTDCNDISDNCYFIAITMNIWNVHYQRSPIDGIVENISYKSGTFKNAVYNAESLKAFTNEQNHITIKNNNTKIKIIQVAGFVARRIVCSVKKHQKLIKGQNIGLIKMGSMVCIILPKVDWILQVKKGDMVIDGETIIAKKKKNT